MLECSSQPPRLLEASAFFKSKHVHLPPCLFCTHLSTIGFIERPGLYIFKLSYALSDFAAGIFCAFSELWPLPRNGTRPVCPACMLPFQPCSQGTWISPAECLDPRDLGPSCRSPNSLSTWYPGWVSMDVKSLPWVPSQ